MGDDAHIHADNHGDKHTNIQAQKPDAMTVTSVVATLMMIMMPVCFFAVRYPATWPVT